MNNFSEAKKRYWSKISPEERSNRMRAIATIKNKNMTPQERVDHAMKMVKARLKVKSK